MPQPKKNYVKWRVNVPTSIADRVSARLHDPITGKEEYGARSRLVAQLLAQWLEEQGDTNNTQLDDL